VGSLSHLKLDALLIKALLKNGGVWNTDVLATDIISKRLIHYRCGVIKKISDKYFEKITMKLWSTA
jgi:hypothetical protein